MFTYLYDTIFPFLFEFFSKLVGVASCPLNEFKNALVNGGYIAYTDLINGSTSQIVLFSNEFVAPVYDLFITIITFNVPTTAPLWVALVLACINGFLVISVFKFLFNIIT